MQEHLGSTPFDDLLVAGATWLLGGCLCWAALIVAAAVIEGLTAGRLRATTWVGCPASLRRVLLAGLGVALASGPGSSYAAPALAVPSERSLPVPARTSGASAPTSGEIVVRPGDSLWRLADARLPTTAPTGKVADLVERLHHRNRDVIGPDPDLIRPGQRLSVPSVRPEQHHHRKESP